MKRQSVTSVPRSESLSLVSAQVALWQRLGEVSDPRKARGRRFPLSVLLVIALCATAAGFGSWRAMAQWAAAAEPQEKLRLGLVPVGAFGLVRAPGADTLRRVLSAVRPGELEVLLRVREVALETVAADGKALRGSRRGTESAVMLIGAMAQDGTLVAQQRVADKSNEIPALTPLLSVLDLRGVVVTADALHTQAETAKVLVEEMGAHFVLTVKRNQPTLWETCRSIPWHEVTAVHKESGRGHGRLETRVTKVVTWGDLAFPYVRQVARVVRHRTVEASGKRTREIVYLITDLTSQRAAPEVVARYARGHWGVENKIHYVRDVTFGEDAARIRTGHGPQNVSTLRSITINFLRWTGSSIADAQRRLALAPHKAPLDLFGVPADQQLSS
ncbi:ISAs1 family transposase [Streptomyces sp. NBC_01320]|uniref:ISAs1 family transposase n=1 Tax=Streptomyces sp. NBC_01320 TaxID=2903824 RepID=UPI002E15925F|nr:ISAs1 family transposase [Streptomyces sp. NBC_01320]WSK01098.1 ISAs1 family transposase [Streptomyces sp. NBC_01320]